MFVSKYKNLTTGETYYKTVYGDSLIEADKQAQRYCRKGFTLLTMTKKD